MKGLLVVLTIAIASGTLLAAGCRKGHHKHARKCGNPEKHAAKMVKHISKRLDLDQSQQQRLEKIKQSLLAEKESAHGLHTGLHEEFRNQFAAGTVDKEQLNTVFDAKFDEMKRLRTVFIDQFAEFHDILTPEQREKALALADKHHKQCGKHGCK